ncbi:hypothetical protein BU26DRAFT_339781 [Trematosphaeria pertusa]|uniref:Uncharacterized protein n=1 Tax=Trematosphaeria pertusa TaxID=390896 RepID=A0A6A6IAD4_9PLEO|nr:uncharacterized protein BU26DRAFT_339781 [Trematosphaeria pertusa]KAF2247018.1 hypothetical protein BU26DRAFT_339781 [Trematosphaeria pertusa]
MSSLLSAILFTTIATAEVTTSMWMPSPYSSEEMGFYGSVVGADGDRLTLALTYDNETNTESLGFYDNSPETVTFVGSTSFEAVVTTADISDNTELTISLGCQARNRARPTCYYSSNGPAVYSSYCSEYLSYTDIITSTELYTYPSDENNPETVVTRVETYDYRDMIPDFCLSGSTIPESMLVETITMNRNYVAIYQIVITAGEQKLKATAGATLTNTAASVTAMVTGTAAFQEGAQSGSATSSPTISTVAGVSGYVEEINAASRVTLAPVLAGFGAAVAAFVL